MPNQILNRQDSSKYCDRINDKIEIKIIIQMIVISCVDFGSYN